MKKEDLQDFDIIITRENKSYFVYNNSLVKIDGDVLETLNLDNYEDNLQRADYRHNYDIMKVLRYGSETQVYNLSGFMAHFLRLNLPTFHKIIFERKEFTEVTMDEIAKKFGVPVEQLKIKK